MVSAETGCTARANPPARPVTTKFRLDSSTFGSMLTGFFSIGRVLLRFKRPRETDPSVRVVARPAIARLIITACRAVGEQAQRDLTPAHPPSRLDR